MEPREVAERARAMAVMVRIQGPDPKGLKMRGHGFHLRENGITSLSASGFLLPGSLADSLSIFGGLKGNGAVVVTIASLVESFLLAKYRAVGFSDQNIVPELIPGAAIDILCDRQKSDSESPSWHPAHLLSIVDVAASSDALKSLVKSESNSTDYGSWDLGWRLAPEDNTSNLREFSSIQKEIPVSVRVAFLGVPRIDAKDFLPIKMSQEQRRGDFLLSVGSPFGILSPSHFLNSVAVGAVANIVPGSSCGSLLIADIRCLPGMEGGPVFDRDEKFVGIIARPIRQKNTSVEIQIIINWDSICASCQDLKKSTKKSTDSSNSPVERATSSVVLITLGDESWASGILINHHGLILTNAHLLEPWRFRKHEEQRFSSSGSESLYLERERSRQSKDPLALSDLGYKHYKRIRVRLNHKEPFIWSDAKVVYLSKGPLDVALLLLDSVPRELNLIVPDFVCPSEGSRVHAIGHGPFGPSSEVHPFVSSGVVTRVVESKFPQIESSIGHEWSKLPVMLQTTASVYPGMSGGAIVDALSGQMIALITSNVRHAGGSTIPHLNFSLPCAALKPVFDFADNMADKSVLLILDKPDAILSCIWALVPPPQPHEDLKGKKEKGSRFAKFLAERTGKDAISNELKPLIIDKMTTNLPSSKL